MLFFLGKRSPPRSTPLYSSAASDVYKGQVEGEAALRDYKKGDEVSAAILSVDSEKDRISCH